MVRLILLTELFYPKAELLFFLMIFPQLLYNFIVIGYPVPELRHGVILDKAGIPPAAPLVKIPETAR